MNPTLQDLRSKRACTDGYNFYAEHNCDPAALVPEHPDWYLWLVEHCPGEWIDPELLDRCAKEEPCAALVYAASLLSPERLDRCAAEEPWDALCYAAALLSPERLDECAKLCPLNALEAAREYLTPLQIAKCQGRIDHLDVWFDHFA